MVHDKKFHKELVAKFESPYQISKKCLGINECLKKLRKKEKRLY